uniref:Protein kinase byr2 n=1 Tax=Anthurium amnicola TaxID=1678845 RepID=A0A1D1YUH2_9ARAE
MGRNALALPVVAAVLLLLGAATPARCWPNARECGVEKALLINACKPVVFGRPPSAQCCVRVRRTPAQCVCPIVTPKLAALVDVNRLVRIVQGCGRPVPRHFKCGSITTP